MFPLDKKLLPQDLEAERAFLGSVMLSANENDFMAVMDVVRPLVKYDHAFALPAHKLIWDVCCELDDNGLPIDLVVMKDRLAAAGRLDACGGVQYIIEIAESVPSAANAEHYARIVATYAKRRVLYVIGSSLVSSAKGTANDVDAFAHEAIKRIEAALAPGLSSTPEAGDVLAQLDFSLNAQAVYEPSGYMSFDHRFGGFARGELSVVAARTSVGKTTFLLNVARCMVERGGRLVYFSLEMSTEQLGIKLTAMLAGVSEHRLRNRDFEPAEAGRYHNAALAEQRQWNGTLYLRDDLSDVGDINRLARALQRKHGVSCIMIDYLHVLSGGEGKNRYEQVGSLSRQCKQLAQKTGLAVILAAQLNRAPESRDGKPRPSDVRDAGIVEEDAGMVVLLSRKDHESNELIVDVAKNRLGRTGELRFRFVYECAQISEAPVGVAST